MAEQIKNAAMNLNAVIILKSGGFTTAPNYFFPSPIFSD